MKLKDNVAPSHFKMYKKGKNWVFGFAFISLLGSTMVAQASDNVKADKPVVYSVGSRDVPTKTTSTKKRPALAHKAVNQESQSSTGDSHAVTYQVDSRTTKPVSENQSAQQAVSKPAQVAKVIPNNTKTVSEQPTSTVNQPVTSHRTASITSSKTPATPAARYHVSSAVQKVARHTVTTTSKKYIPYSQVNKNDPTTEGRVFVKNANTSDGTTKYYEVLKDSKENSTTLKEITDKTTLNEIAGAYANRVVKDYYLDEKQLKNYLNSSIKNPAIPVENWNGYKIMRSTGSVDDLVKELQKSDPTFSDANVIVTNQEFVPLTDANSTDNSVEKYTYIEKNGKYYVYDETKGAFNEEPSSALSAKKGYLDKAKAAKAVRTNYMSNSDLGVFAKKYQDEIKDVVENSTDAAKKPKAMDETSGRYQVFVTTDEGTAKKESERNYIEVKTEDGKEGNAYKELFFAPGDAGYTTADKRTVAVVDGRYYEYNLKDGKFTEVTNKNEIAAIKRAQVAKKDTVADGKVKTSADPVFVQKLMPKSDANNQALQEAIKNGRNTVKGTDGQEYYIVKTSDPKAFNNGAFYQDSKAVRSTETPAIGKDEFGVLKTTNPGFNITIGDYTTQPDEGGHYYTGINGGHDLLFFKNWYSNNDTKTSPINISKAGATQGIVEKRLGDDGFPVLASGSNQSLAYLFDSDSSQYATKINLDPANANLFTTDGEGNYSFDSSKNYARLVNDKLIVYNQPAVYSDTQGRGQFFPLGDVKNVFSGDSLPTSAEDKSISLKAADPVNNKQARDEANDHYFGMSMSVDYTQPENGQINDKDSVFNFSGDDDFWLYIDGNLVLDIGGAHGVVGGSINFKTGNVTVDGAKNQNLDNILGGDWNTAGVNHKINIFYLERGNYESNLKMNFNLSIPEYYYATSADYATKMEKIYPVYIYGKSNSFGVINQVVAGVQQRYGIKTVTTTTNTPPEPGGGNEVPPLIPGNEVPPTPDNNVPPLIPGNEVPPSPEKPKVPETPKPSTPTKTPSLTHEMGLTEISSGQILNGTPGTWHSGASVTYHLVNGKYVAVPLEPEAKVTQPNFVQNKLPQTGETSEGKAVSLLGLVTLAFSVFGFEKLFKKQD